jgi:coatomer subunit beta'
MPLRLDPQRVYVCPALLVTLKVAVHLTSRPPRSFAQRSFSQRSERIKGIDLHPTEPWVAASLYSGHVCIWNYETSTLVNSFEATELPVRTVKFIPRKQWLVCGADDMTIRVYNYNTMEKVVQFEAHQDYIRHVAVHPTLPLVISCSDDMTIKLWDWEKEWMCTQLFEGHGHYVMHVAFNPKDTNTFASASLDRTVKVWSLGSPVPNFTLEGHERGVNCVDYYVGGDKPYLVSGADDSLVKIWDYQTKACIQTLDGHSHNISCVKFHPELPLILTGSEDGTLKMWHSTTYRLESSLNYGMERTWGIATARGSNAVAIGYDEGCVMITMGREDPLVSMDASGKVIWARHNEIQTVNIKALGDDVGSTEDGERLPLAIKDLGNSDVYPQSLQHSPNGRFVAVCGDGEYVVYTALAWRNKAYGSALEFAWGQDSNCYATRESSSTIKVYKNFKEAFPIKVPFTITGIHGGALLGVRTNDFIMFLDWQTGETIRRIDVSVKNVYWSESGSSVAILSDEAVYLLSFQQDVVDAVFESGEDIDEEEGIEAAFELQAEIPEVIKSGIWVGDCFIYNNSSWRLNYCIGGETTTLQHLDRPMYLLGYMAAQSRIFLVDRDFGVTSFSLLLSVVEFKTLILRGDFDTADMVLESVPGQYHNDLAKFLEAKGETERALAIATDDDYKFDLTIALGDLQQASNLALKTDSEAKWRQLGELAFSAGDMTLSESCFNKSSDWSGLLMLYSAQGNVDGIRSLSRVAHEHEKENIAFTCKFMTGDVRGCVDLLIECGRLPEAAFFARTYCPSRVTEIVGMWQADLMKVNPKAAESLANPEQYPNLFPGWEEALEKERSLMGGAGSPDTVFANMSLQDQGESTVPDVASQPPVSLGARYSRENEVYESDMAEAEDVDDVVVGEEDVFGDAEGAIEEEYFGEEEATTEGQAFVEEEAEQAPVEDNFAEEEAPVKEEAFAEAHKPEEDGFAGKNSANKPKSVEAAFLDPMFESTPGPLPTMQPEATPSSPPDDLGDEDGLELTKEEEALLEAELDGEDIDLDDDWGDDDF